MTESQPTQPTAATAEVRKLPWMYWPIALGGLVLSMVVGVVLCVAVLPVNPYIGAAIAGVAYALAETWKVGRWQSR
jgi:hypothetical protein